MSRTWTARAIGPLAVAIASAGGALAGNALCFPGCRTAILYPPYAVVTAALLMSPPRRWWVYLLAGSAGTFWPHHLNGAPIGFVLMTDLANYVRALVAAIGVRRFADRGSPLDSLRGAVAFLLFGGVLAPLAGAFVGAGVVAWYRGPGAYWGAWTPWLLSNVLAGLALLPVILFARSRWSELTEARWNGARAAEAGGLLATLLVIGGLVLLGQPGRDGALAAGLYAPVPVLFWAAVRFGPAATSGSLLLVAVLAISGTLTGRGPFHTGSPAQDLIRLQLFLFFTSAPLLLLAALLKDRQRASEQLRASQREYETVVEDQIDMICRFGPAGELTFVNGACCQRTGRSRRELLGTSFWSLFPPDTREDRRRLLRRLTPARAFATWEDGEDGPAGQSQWEQWRVRALFDEHGGAVGYQALGRDVTEHKRAEEQRALLRAEQAMTEALLEADRRKDQFVAMVAHELRNPLAPITLAVDVLGQALAPTDEEAGAAHGIIRRQTAHLGRLVEDLLDVARVTNGTIQMRAEAVQLSLVLADAIETSTPIIESNRLELVIEWPDAGTTVRGDRMRLAQLFSNLLNNAAKYSPDGGRVDLRVVCDGGQAIVSVRDRGAGIPAEMLERVFESFAQVDQSRDAALGGLGLGLALAKRIAELHGGRIHAESDGPGTGSLFVVRLPVV